MTTKDLIVRAAKTLLAHHEAGRECDPHSLEWARWIVKHNSAPDEPRTEAGKEAA